MTVALESSLGTAHSAAELLTLYQIETEDLERVARAGTAIAGDLDQHIDLFYVWLEKQSFFSQFFSDVDSLARVKALQIQYWNAFFGGQVDEKYVAQRRTIGETHARIGLPHRFDLLQ